MFSKQKKLQSFLIIFTILLFFVGINAQLEDFEVKSLKFKLSNTGGSQSTRITVETNKFTQTAGAEGFGNSSLLCSPCLSGNYVSISHAPLYYRVRLNSGGYMSFSFLRATASAQGVRIPYYYPFRRPVIFRRPSHVQGRLNIWREDSNGEYLIYDKDINMDGQAYVKFRPLESSGLSRRETGFIEAIYTYEKDEN